MLCLYKGMWQEAFRRVIGVQHDLNVEAVTIDKR